MSSVLRRLGVGERVTTKENYSENGNKVGVLCGVLILVLARLYLIEFISGGNLSLRTCEMSVHQNMYLRVVCIPLSIVDTGVALWYLLSKLCNLSLFRSRHLRL